MKPIVLIRNLLIGIFGVSYTVVSFFSIMGAGYQPPIFATVQQEFFNPLSLNTSPWIMFTGSGTAVRFSQIAYYNAYGEVHTDQLEKSGIDSLLPTAKEKFHGALVDVGTTAYASAYLQYLCKHNQWGANAVRLESVWIRIQNLPLAPDYPLGYQPVNTQEC